MPTHKIRLTEPQTGWAKYAIEQVSTLEWDTSEKPPRLDGRTLVFPEPSQQVVIVFLDALENQLRDECRADGVGYPSPANSLVRKVRTAYERGLVG